MQSETSVTDFALRTVGDVVADDYRRAEIFKKFGIDFCCGGKKTVADACMQRNVNLRELVDALAKVGEESTTEAVDFAGMAPAALVDHIVGSHHAYVNESLPILLDFTKKLARVHGESHPELVEIAKLFEAVEAELREHMMKEEKILFPYIKEMDAAKSADALEPSCFGSVRNPIDMMEHEHENAGSVMKQIRQLSSDYSPPEDACNTYRAAYHKLEEFEANLHQHIHLENNILFPQAIQLEQTVNRA